MLDFRQTPWKPNNYSYEALGSLQGHSCKPRGANPRGARDESSAKDRVKLQTRIAAQESSQEPDIITKVFGGLFGKNALENKTPFGMQRMEEEDMYELYPATTTEFADPVDGDSKDVASFRPLLAKTRLERLPLRMAFDANEHGWSPDSFHSRCDGYGAAVVLARTVSGIACGGYNPQGWIGLSEDRDSNAAFLFVWPDNASTATKLPKVGGPNLAVLDGASEGIQFGAEGLKIGLQPGREKEARSRLGSYYARMPGGGKSLFVDAAKGRVELSDLKVFVADGDPEQWTLDGIMWKSKDGKRN